MTPTLDFALTSLTWTVEALVVLYIVASLFGGDAG